jgi:hypothetical protein
MCKSPPLVNYKAFDRSSSENPLPIVNNELEDGKLYLPSAIWLSPSVITCSPKANDVFPLATVLHMYAVNLVSSLNSTSVVNVLLTTDATLASLLTLPLLDIYLPISLTKISSD